PRVRPYIGIGGGIAVPHVEVWFPGANAVERTNEYQYAGPAAQAVAGFEISAGRVTYFVEYKFTYAWISSTLTADQSWKNFNMPGDLFRQFRRWLAGSSPKIGTISTTLGAHQIVAGAGYTWRAPKADPSSR
ncbi:MAG TPA: lipid A oxidase, partial [Hyphomicrobiaceae bacterium]|nr:lipid A oxidase [Hyphomicrobiaceae bacterium]